MPVVKRASGIPFIQGGNAHSGWLPPGAAEPPPEPIRRYTLDVTIEYEPGSGFLLIWESREDPGIAYDEWYPGLTEAENAAQRMFGFGPDRWEPA